MCNDDNQIDNDFEIVGVSSKFNFQQDFIIKGILAKLADCL